LFMPVVESRDDRQVTKKDSGRDKCLGYIFMPVVMA
jgi:hypothetical protein